MIKGLFTSRGGDAILGLIYTTFGLVIFLDEHKTFWIVIGAITTFTGLILLSNGVFYWRKYEETE